MKLHLMILLAFFPLTRSSNNQTTFTNESDNLTAVTKPTKNITVAATKNNSTTGSNQNLTIITKPPSNITIVAKQYTNLTTKQPSKELLLEGVYWEIKPYIFINHDGQLDGIIPMIFREAQKYCIKRNDSSMYELMQFQQHVGSRQEYFELVRSRNNSNDSKVVYLPDISFAYLQDEHLAYDRGLKSVELLKSKLAVIVPRYMISLPNKIVRGIGGCKQILVLAFMLSILFGMVVWLVERPFNDNFPSSFFRGTGQSLWWSIVSMTTVGYGDVVPRTLLGRVIAVVWLYLGVILACVVTATVTGVVTGISDLTIYKQRVAVLQNSFESKVAQDDYSAKIVPAQSYTEVLQLVRSGDAFAAVMNLDVASWLQDEINSNTASVPLRVIEILPRNVFVQALMSKQANVRAHEALACMYTNHSDEVIQRSSGHFQRHLRTETLHIETLYELFRYNLMYQVLMAALIILVSAGLLFELHLRKNQKPSREQKKLTVKQRRQHKINN